MRHTTWRLHYFHDVILVLEDKDCFCNVGISLFYSCSPFLIRDRELKRREEENWNAGTTSLSALFFSSWNSAVNLATGGGGGGGSSSSGGSSSKDKKQQQRSDNSRHERQGSVSPTASMPATPSAVPLPQNKSGKKQVSKKPWSKLVLENV